MRAIQDRDGQPRLGVLRSQRAIVAKMAHSVRLGRNPFLGRGALEAAIEVRGLQGVVPQQQCESLCKSLQVSLVALMETLVSYALEYASPNVSGYRAGAVARGATTGALYFGANLELANMPTSLTLHAEQAAVNNAWLHGEAAISDLALSAAPCGFCRQFLRELPGALDLVIHAPGIGPRRLADLLPDSFGPDDLGAVGALMMPQYRSLTVQRSGIDELIATALHAAGASYAPYSHSYAGVALATPGGVFEGRYAENAALNPSMLAVQSALVMWRLAGSPEPIERAVIVETPGPTCQTEITKAVLASLMVFDCDSTIAEVSEAPASGGALAG